MGWLTCFRWVETISTILALGYLIAVACSERNVTVACLLALVAIKHIELIVLRHKLLTVSV